MKSIVIAGHYPEDESEIIKRVIALLGDSYANHAKESGPNLLRINLLDSCSDERAREIFENRIKPTIKESFSPAGKLSVSLYIL